MHDEFKFEVGDRVVITTDGLEYLGIPKGTKGTVTEDYSHEPWVEWDVCEKYPDDKTWAAGEEELELIEIELDGRGAE